jgi:hypothetical protein
MQSAIEFFFSPFMFANHLFFQKKLTMVPLTFRYGDFTYSKEYLMILRLPSMTTHHIDNGATLMAAYLRNI